MLMAAPRGFGWIAAVPSRENKSCMKWRNPAKIVVGFMEATVPFSASPSLQAPHPSPAERFFRDIALECKREDTFSGARELSNDYHALACCNAPRAQGGKLASKSLFCVWTLSRDSTEGNHP